MGKPSQEQIDAWIEAAGKSKVSPAVQARIVTAAQFIENTARLKKADDLLGGIDFSKPVKVVNKLPTGVYVQYAGKHKGRWFTSTGLTPDHVGIAKGNRKRKLFKPAGSVAALQSTAKSIKDTWTPGRILKDFDPKSGRKGETTSGGGTQYLVANPSQMDEA